MHNTRHKKYRFIFFLLFCLCLALFSFWQGEKYATSKIKKQNAVKEAIGLRPIGENAPLGGGRNGTIVSGEVTAKDGKNITLKTTTGASKDISLAHANRIQKTISGTIKDITIGTQIVVVGSNGSDGTFNALSVQIKNSTE